MNRVPRHRYLLWVLLLLSSLAPGALAQTQVTIDSGALAGILREDTGIRIYKGIPFAAPPVGKLRWQAPQPVQKWRGVREALRFGPRCMQLPLFGDMNFKSDGMSEDCLYLNLWTPAKSAQEKLPVLVYFYGGGFAAGDGSEPRYNGESMAQEGIVTLTVNYRLGVFGFLAHPALSKEAPYKASGNYGFLDQYAALKWVHNNIAAFGGDPERVTIAGESAGSVSVSALMASPLSKGLIAGAIGESGAAIGPPRGSIVLAEAEQEGLALASRLGAGANPSLRALRKMPAEKLLAATERAEVIYFSPNIDGYFWPKSPAEIYAAGGQAQVPLLAGVNSEELPYRALLGDAEPTVENYRNVLRQLYPEHADELFRLYPATSKTEVMDAAQDLAGDRFVSYGTWKWVDLATRFGEAPTYYYLFSRPRPPMRAELGNAVAGLAGGVITDKNAEPPPVPRGAAHAAEIEYALGNLHLNDVYAWTPDDYKVSQIMKGYFANFVKTGNPNGDGLPEWPRFSSGQRQVIDVDTRTESAEFLRARYEFLDRFYLPDLVEQKAIPEDEVSVPHESCRGVVRNSGA